MNRFTSRIPAALALMLAAAPVASAAPAISMDGNIPAYPGGYVKGPDVPVYFTTGGWSNSALSRIVTVSAGPAQVVLPNPPPGPNKVILRGFADGGEYNLQLVASQQVANPLLNTETAIAVRHIRVDASAPSAPYVTVNGGGPRYTNRLSVSINIAAGGDHGLSGAGIGEIRLSEAAFGTCTLALEEDGTGCFAFPPSGIFNGTITLPAGPDGPRTAWVRTRDRAFVSCTAPGDAFSACDHTSDGNVSPAGFGPNTILLDTTPPVAALAVASPSGVAGTPLALDASPSSDPGGANASGVDPKGFRWDFGDGSPVLTGQPAAVAHLYPGPGSYRAEVRATDRAGNAAALKFTAAVTVSPGPAGGGGGTTPPVTTPATPTTPAPVTPPPSGVGSAGGPAAAPGSPVTRGPGGTTTRTAAPRITGLMFVPDRGVAVTASAAGRVVIRVLTPSRAPIASFARTVGAGRTVIPSPAGVVARTTRRRGRVLIVAQLRVGGVASPVRTIGVAAAVVAAASPSGRR